MATINDAKRLWHKTQQQNQAARLIEADLTAVANDDGVTSVKVTDSDTVNLVWAKLRGQDERIVQAYNGRVQPRNLLPVWIRQLADGTYEIEGVRSRDGSDFLGEALGTMNLPEIIGMLMTVVWPMRNLMAGRVRLSEVGGLTVWVEPFYYSGGRFAGANFDLTPYVPVTTDMQAWAVIWYDPVSDALGATVGTEYNLAYTMTEIDLGAIALSPTYIRLAGVLLTEGDTVIDAATVIVAAQDWFDAPVTQDNFFPIEITNEYTIPANRQQPARRCAVTGDGVLTVNGVLDVF